MSAIDESSIYDSIPKHARHIAKSAKRRLAELKTSKEPVGLSTGFRTLDDVGVRLVDGELVVELVELVVDVVDEVEGGTNVVVDVVVADVPTIGIVKEL